VSRNSQTDIGLKQAEAKFTKAKTAVDGTAAREKAYQKAKRELWVARQAWRAQGRPRPKAGDAVAAPKSISVKAKKPGKENN